MTPPSDASDAPGRHFPVETAAEGPWRGPVCGPVYSYRGAEIPCGPGGRRGPSFGLSPASIG
jgi:hypothetical protein